MGACMEYETVWQLAFIFGLVGFGIWFSKLSFELNKVINDIGHRGEDIDEIRESVEIVAAILERLPELLPQFHQHQSPLQPIIEWFVNKNMQNDMLGNSNESLQAGSAPERDEAGQYAPKT